MQIKMFYAYLPFNEDPTPLIAKLEQDANEWLKTLSHGMTLVQTAFTPPNSSPSAGGIIITVSHEPTPPRGEWKE